MSKRLTINRIIRLKESEDNVEFKEAKGGNISYNGGNKPEPSKRRRCILGYVIALANEGGGKMVFGIKEGKHGTGSGTTYSMGENLKEDMKIVDRAIELGMKQLRENGEIG